MPKALSGLMGMRHIALNVKDVERSKAFYQDILGMEVVWQPDPQNAYLSSGTDNLALHETPGDRAPAATSSLDHLGFIVSEIDRVRELESEFRARDRSRSSSPSNSTATAAPRSIARIPDGDRHSDALRADVEPAEDRGRVSDK